MRLEIVVALAVVVFVGLLWWGLSEGGGRWRCKHLNLHSWITVKIVGPSGTVITKKVCRFCGKEKS